MRARQLSLLPKSAYLQREHGGTLRQGRRKIARAVSTRDSMHIVLRSSRAKGGWSMLHPKHQAHVGRTVRETARKHGLRLYQYTNVGNHLHLLVRAPTRTAFKRFLREVSGVIAVIVTGAKKGNALGRFWDYIPYTRIVSWGRDFKNLETYFVKNFFEAAGLLTKKIKAQGYEIISMAGWSGKPPS